MYKTGAKFLFALAGFGLLSAVLWAAATGDHALGMDSLIGPLTFGYKGYVGDHAGYTLLVGLSVAALFLGIFLSALRDADPEAEAQLLGLDTVPDVEPPVTVNYWPVVAAFSAGAVVIGLAIGPIMFTIGMIGLVVCLVEWAVRAWADRATGDPAVNQSIRDRFLQPVEIPALAVIGIAGLVLAVSRILLALPKIGSYLVFGLVPVAILAVGALIVLRPQLSQSVIAGLLLFGGVAILAGGVAAAIAGEREHGGEHEGEEHHSSEGEGESGLAPLPAPTSAVIWVGNR
jgi:hypothetical protein